jgi:hypothetical protein
MLKGSKSLLQKLLVVGSFSAFGWDTAFPLLPPHVHFETFNSFFGPTGDIFESFSSHPPLILPLGSSRLRLSGPVTDDALHRELRRLRRLLWDLEQQELPANHRHGPPVAASP